MDYEAINENNEKDNQRDKTQMDKRKDEALLNLLEEMVARGFRDGCGQLKLGDNRNTKEKLA